MAGLSDATQLDGGDAHVCARRATGAALCWGDNYAGQIGDGTIGPNRVTPAPVFAITDALEVAAASGHTCARRASGAVTCWGEALHNQYGDGLAPNAVFAPTAVLNLADAAQITGGLDHFCALRTGGALACWGRNSQAQLGDNALGVSRSLIAPVMNLTDAVEVVGGWQHTCARRRSGVVMCWGDNRGGQIGDGTTRNNRLVPAAVSGITDAAQLALGSFTSCALRAGGSVLCWGDNMFGQVGNGAGGTNAVSPTPAAVMNLSDATAIAAGWMHICARRATGAVVCWGSNSEGQLGDGTMNARSVPVPVTGITDAVELVGGIAHTCARRATGAVMCWGRNGSGQLGDGTTTQRMSPSAVMGLTDAVELASHTDVTCARRTGGTVVCWGPGANPDGTGATRLSPTPVMGITDAVEIAISNGSFCARRATGAVVCTGGFAFGQIGAGPLHDAAL